MCYLIYMSTTSPEDLSPSGGGLFRLFRVDAANQEPALTPLRHPRRWYLESKQGGCSCHFRHWMEVNGDEFGPPVEWFPEDEEDVESTTAFYDVIARLVSEGHDVDLVDVWNGTDAEAVRAVDVSLSDVDRESFRFFESARFAFKP